MATKKIVEKKTGEKYASKVAMAKHEKKETKAEQMKEMKKASPMKMSVSKKTAYNIKEASNQKLKPSARKHYVENAQAAMKNKKASAVKMKKC
jgi:6-phosphogluconolactonase (cycloisomerase 2 family)